MPLTLEYQFNSLRAYAVNFIMNEREDDDITRRSAMRYETIAFQQDPKFYNEIIRQISKRKSVYEAIKIASHSQTLR